MQVLDLQLQLLLVTVVLQISKASQVPLFGLPFSTKTTRITSVVLIGIPSVEGAKQRNKYPLLHMFRFKIKTKLS